MKFSIVGTGNVGWHFSKMLVDSGHQLLQVVTRERSHATGFPGDVIISTEDLSAENELVLLAVRDDVIAEVSAGIATGMFVVHASGATPMNVIGQVKRGVIWPAQSIKKDVPMDYTQLPLLVEASGEDEKNMLLSVLSEISGKVYYADSGQRQMAHLAAVFANNFVNHFYMLAEGLMKESGLPFGILLPMIGDASEKMKTKSPQEAQTGPAFRADLKTLQTHLSLLATHPQLKELYLLLTNRILEHYHGKKL